MKPTISSFDPNMNLRQKPFKGIIRFYFLQKYRFYKYNNQDRKCLQRKPNQKRKDLEMKKPHRRIDPSHLNQEDLEKIINHYYEIINEDKNHEHYDRFKTIIKDSQSSTRK